MFLYVVVSYLLYVIIDNSEIVIEISDIYRIFPSPFSENQFDIGFMYPFAITVSIMKR